MPPRLLISPNKEEYAGPEKKSKYKPKPIREDLQQWINNYIDKREGVIDLMNQGYSIEQIKGI